MKVERTFHRAASFVRRFRENQHGGTIMLIAAMALPLVVATGLAIDGGRGYLLRARLGDAIDAAGLAATLSVADSQNFQSDLEQIFYANFPSGYLNAAITLDSPVVSQDQMTITYSARATIDTTFMRLVGINTLTVAKSAEVTRQTASLDLVISMDISGSMDDNNRIEGARDAANTLIDILYGDDAFKDHLKIGVVPWNSKVNVTNGTSYSSSTSEVVTSFTNPITGLAQSVVYYANNSTVPLLSAPPANWQGCVFARYLHDGNADNDADLLLGPISVGGKDWPAWRPVGAADEPSPGGSCSSCGACSDHSITRLTSERLAVEQAIDALTDPNGHTNIVQGLAWAFRVLSPGEPFDDAEANPVGHHQRAIVLLTDGEHYGNAGDAYDGAFGSGTSAGANGLDGRLRDLATYIKSQGIKIYTIQYYFDNGPLATLMQDVASESGSPYYHFAPDAASLSEVFEEIGNHLSNLRLSM